MAYFGVIFFANMGGGGGQNYFQKTLVRPSESSKQETCWCGVVRGKRSHRARNPEVKKKQRKSDFGGRHESNEKGSEKVTKK